MLVFFPLQSLVAKSEILLSMLMSNVWQAHWRLIRRDRCPRSKKQNNARVYRGLPAKSRVSSFIYFFSTHFLFTRVESCSPLYMVDRSTGSSAADKRELTIFGGPHSADDSTVVQVGVYTVTVHEPVMIQRTAMEKIRGKKKRTKSTFDDHYPCALGLFALAALERNPKNVDLRWSPWRWSSLKHRCWVSTLSALLAKRVEFSADESNLSRRFLSDRVPS